MKRWSALFAIAAVVVLGAGISLDTAAVAQEKKAKPHVERDLVYGKGGDEELQLDLVRPEGQGPFPALICIHGGGWKSGRRQDLTKLAAMLANRGFVAVTVSYRLSDKAIFPAQIEDCKAAVRWLRANAKKHDVNPDCIGAIGFSAGGHLACLLGAADKSAGLEGKGGNPEQSSKVQAVVSFFGPTDFVTKTWDKRVEEAFFVPFLGGSYEEKRDVYRKCSPLEYVTNGACPFLFFHGDEDKLVNISHSQKMAKKLQNAGVSAKLVTMENEGHGWTGEKLTQTLDQAITFFQEKLKK
ncbi:MAG: alpha/beta hydrolase [Planctomycetes bacterium]|nr:alpha/beta hydrolase [Planctomycetota bacterium]